MAEYLDLSLSAGVLAVAGPALAVRLASLPLLTRAQAAVRGRVSADGPSPGLLPLPVAGELALGAVAGLGLWMFLDSHLLTAFALLLDSIALGQGWALAMAYGLSLSAARVFFVAAGVPVLLLWLFLWHRTRRNLLTVPGTPPARTVPAAQLAVRLVAGLFLPVGLVLAALVCQVVALAMSRRAGRAGAAGPVPRQASPYDPPRPYAGAAPYAAPNPYVETADQAVPPRVERGQVPPPHAPAAATPAPPATAPAGYRELRPHEPQAIGGYRLLGRIGAGGMGTVYLARREGAATQVALKTLNPELLDQDDLLRRFEREAEVLAMVPGAYTARVLDSGVDAGRPYLVMELLDGRPLDAHLAEQGPVRAPEALRALALALAVALSGVHRLGLVHRDLKPANIMLTSAGPRLLDFGIAAIVDGTRLTRTGGGPGTLTYMAPEQFGEAQAGPAADVWAWACCVVCAAHGTSPFAATSTGAVIRRIVETGPEPAALAAVRALDPDLAATVARALTPDPAARPADGAALVALLTPGHPLTVPDQITRGWRTLPL
ncbi:serine/threonine-protein kinase [Streptomyces sp. NPDC101132]|uniref:serine/threonine-protein kinase n=1 Tax=Streptomyces sp. NPDC101132 TaxID=3366110 RepID=UPI003829A138